MKNKLSLLIFTCLSVMGILITSLLNGSMVTSAIAAPQAQVPIYTPTPGPDGKIIWIVKSNDTLLSISLITNVPVDTLRQLNNLTSDIILEGQHLIIGLAGPALVTPTLGPTPTSTPILPTPSPKPGLGSLCVLLFNDSNGDSIRQEEELSIPQGAISINNRIGSVSITGETQPGAEHQCFENLPEGDYTISVAIPEGYNPTTVSNYAVPLRAGDLTYINFGAQANTQTLANAPVLPSEGERSPLLGIIGGILLLAGIGTGIYAGRMLKSR